MDAAAFEKATERLLKLEAGYVNHPNDKGGETIYGISRVYNPRWDGWRLIDGWKRSNPADFVLVVEASIKLREMAYEFYRTLFWVPLSKLWGGGGKPDPFLVGELLDQAVHLGTKRAISHLQRVLNVLNRRGELWDDLVLDGLVGPATRKAYWAAMANGDASDVRRGLDILQGAYLFNRIESDDSQESFTRGWFRRVFVPHYTEA